MLSGTHFTRVYAKSPQPRCRSQPYYVYCRRRAALLRQFFVSPAYITFGRMIFGQVSYGFVLMPVSAGAPVSSMVVSLSLLMMRRTTGLSCWVACIAAPILSGLVRVLPGAFLLTRSFGVTSTTSLGSAVEDTSTLGFIFSARTSEPSKPSAVPVSENLASFILSGASAVLPCDERSGSDGVDTFSTISSICASS